MTLDCGDALMENSLVKLQTLLESVGETFWRNKVSASLGDQVDIDGVLSWYGGMGSINDLVIAAVNGHHLGTRSEWVLNKELNQLRDEVFSIAKEQRRIAGG